ncbi:MAG: hypothetical protein AABY22_23150, partial [Nanoarchaeota archaeon]
MEKKYLELIKLMEKKYLELIKLQEETSGATFLMGYSLRSKKHYITFNNVGKRFDDAVPARVIEMAIDWIKDTRRPG